MTDVNQQRHFDKALPLQIAPGLSAAGILATLLLQPPLHP